MTGLDALPVWGQAALLFVVLVAAFELAAHTTPEAATNDDSNEGYMVSAALGLLALLLGFTFSLSLTRYELRRTLVVEEATAVAQIWHNSDFLGDPLRAEAKRRLLAYAEERLAVATAGEDAAAVARAEARAATERTQLWQALMPTIAAAPAGSSVPTLIDPLNALFGLATTSKAALSARIPTHVVAVLCLYTIIAAAILGYAIGLGRNRHRAATTALFALIAMTVGLILDLDRSRSGTITISQSPLADVVAEMRGRGQAG